MDVRALRKLCGPFVLVIWDRVAGRVVAARDPLGVAPLYYQLGPDSICLSDTLDGFGDRGRLDKEFIADFLTRGGACADRTIWTSVQPVLPGTTVAWSCGRASVSRFWTAETVPALSSIDLPEAALRFKELLTRSVASNLDSPGATWAHLSGGIDSSSVSCIAATVGQGSTACGLGGTITFTDSLGNGDESDFSDAVVSAFGLRNEKIADYWPWRSDGAPPPQIDQPTRDYPYYARERFTTALIRRSGGTAVLSGVGPDQFLTRSDPRIGALLASGRVRQAATILSGLAAAKRKSFFKTAINELVLPALPMPVQRWSALRTRPFPPWLTQRADRKYGLRRRMGEFVAGRSRQAGEHAQRVDRSIQWMAATLPAWHSQYGVDIRHPFLHLPLVEFCIQLPGSVRPYDSVSKLVLREAMRGLLPETVRCRFTKGIIAPRICWAFHREEPRLRRLLKSSILADLGFVEPKKVLAAIEASARGTLGDELYLYCALSLETWLAARANLDIGWA
jgi:asparagine synthase (glutamine-hydrolysing)